MEIGAASLPLQGSFAQGEEVIAFARPHELDILPQASVGEGIAARVARVLTFGIRSRVELDSLEGLRAPIEVELSREQLQSLALQEGQLVALRPQRLQLFARQLATGVAA